MAVWNDDTRNRLEAERIAEEKARVIVELKLQESIVALGRLHTRRFNNDGVKEAIKKIRECAFWAGVSLGDA